MSGILPKTFVKGFHNEEDVKKMVYRPLGSLGVDVSIISFGASSLGSVFRKTNDEESVQVVMNAVKSGINLIDTAPWYGFGKSERVLGMALKKIPREAYYLNTKVGRYVPEPLEMFDFSGKRVLASIDESLERLGIEYIDSIQIHDPEFCPNLDIILQETLPALELARRSGKVRWIGMTGYPLEMQKYVIENSKVKIDTSLVYCHYSMNDTTLLNYLDFFKKADVALINASPLSMSLLTARGPPKWHPAMSNIREACVEATNYAAERGVDISRLALKFSLSNEDIPTTLISTASIKRLADNIQTVQRELTGKEQEVSDHLMECIFSKLKGNEMWEDLEVSKYWEKVGKLSIISKVYGEKYLRKRRESKEKP